MYMAYYNKACLTFSRSSINSWIKFMPSELNFFFYLRENLISNNTLI